jgi:hypothetical protein
MVFLFKSVDYSCVQGYFIPMSRRFAVSIVQPILLLVRRNPVCRRTIHGGAGCFASGLEDVTCFKAV